MSIFRKLFLSAAFALCMCIFCAHAAAQEILLDKMETCGDLICYPSLDSPQRFYYLPDQPRLAYKNGRPQFSFLKYARTKETGEAGTGRAEGGGIVHFLVTYGADEARVRAAESALQETREDARIVGPVVYRTGSFALITSFAEGAETFTRAVAVGRAPLMEGQKAAVSMALTREGAELLWESFQSDTPDISIVFDMEFAGIREPYEATLEADWSRISKHHRLQVGGRYAWFGADVDLLFQELRQTGAVKITTKGEDANMDKVLQSAHSKLLSVMFDPAPDELSRMAAEKGSYDNLNQAVKMLKGEAAGGKKTSELSPLPCPEKQAHSFFHALYKLIVDASLAHAAESEDQETVKDAYEKAGALYQQQKYQEAVKWLNKGLALNDKSDRLQQAKFLHALALSLHKLERYEEATGYFKEALNFVKTDERKGRVFFYLGHCLEAKGSDLEAIVAFRSVVPLLGEQSGKSKESVRRIEAISSRAYNEARRLDAAARSGGYAAAASQKALTAYQDYLEHVRPSGRRSVEVEGRIRYLTQKMGNETGKSPASGVAKAGQGTASPDVAADTKDSGKSTEAAEKDDSQKQVLKSLTDKVKKKDKDEKKQAEEQQKKKAEPEKSREKDTPGFSLVASYQMKHIKRSGKMVYQMNHYRTETQAFAMSENIGNLYRRYGSDPRIFRAMNIDDPVFKQREILVTLDGQDSETFSRHMNFVTVQMKKRHQSGELTTDEVVITPERFNQQGNAFILSYGWKGDDDRSDWLDYDVETLWSFHGGMKIRIPPAVHDSAMVALQPPHRYRTITVEGEGNALTEAQVRHAVLTFTSYVDGKPLTTEATIRNQGPASSLILDIPEERDGMPTSVEITWYLRGGRTITAPARELEGNIIYWDELPEKEV